MLTTTAAPEPPLYAQLTNFERAMITTGVMIAAMMQAIDSTVANVALPHMQTGLGASRETVTWVLTSYIVAMGVAIPITGWLANRVGRRRLFIAALAAFTLASGLCSIAASISAMVLFRLLQGAAGAFLMPMAQAYLFDINPPERHARAMRIYGSGIVIGPLMGPVLGGWITENLDWRWVFTINLPIGVGCILLTFAYLPSSKAAPRRFDLTGYALLAITVASLQLMLDRGEHNQWFDSTETWVELCVIIAAGWMFLVHMLTHKEPVIELRLFANRNYLMGLGYTASTSLVMYSGAALLPPMLQTLMGYPVLDAGMLALPRAIGMFLSMHLLARLTSFLDPRLSIMLGVGVSAYSLHMMAGFSLQMDYWPVVISGLLQGAGIGIIWIPITMLAFGTLPSELRTAASSLTSLTRSLTGSFGVSLVTTIFARSVQTNHSELASRITATDMPGSLRNVLGQSRHTAAAMLDAEINRQAAMIAYDNVFYLCMIATLITLPLAFVLGRKPKANAISGE